MVITTRMLKWLEEPDKGIEKSIYMKRIQKRITETLNNTLELVNKYPHIFLDEEIEISHERETCTDKSCDICGNSLIPHRRMKKLILIIQALQPESYIELSKKREEPKVKWETKNSVMIEENQAT